MGALFDGVGPRNRGIDQIRGVAILLVLLHHFDIAYPLRGTAAAWLGGWDWLRAIVRNGNYGVTMFFVVSGYLITSNALRRWGSLDRLDAARFYALRAARILPCLLLLLAVANLLAVAGLRRFQSHPALPFWLIDIAALTSWVNVLIARDGWFNYPLGVLWSLSVEEMFYLTFPILCLTLRRETALLAFWAVLVVVGPVYRFVHHDEGAVLYAYFACFDSIAIGCCTALLARRVILPPRDARVLQLVVAAVMAAVYLCRPIGQTNVIGVTAMALGTSLLLIASRERPDLGGGRAGAPLRWLGRLSYELYLFHLVVLGLLVTLIPPGATAGGVKPVLLAVFLIVSACVANLIGRFYAEATNRWLRRRLLTR
jgi:peptidoglycan/LPS O-acetylase OafA/YrhL